MHSRYRFTRIGKPAAERHLTRFWTAMVVGISTSLCGCEGNRPVVVYGAVTCAGDTVERGDITFVPLDAKGGAGGGAEIIDGAYRVHGRQGVLPGTYRVVVNAFEKTGRKITQSNGFETTLVDETRRVGPPIYASSDSPLVVSIDASFSNPLDIELTAE
jgi:hypothetical protein